MNKKELAKLIDGREYGYEPFRDVRQAAKEAGLIIVSGASDDLMEFDGAIYAEGDCYKGGKVFFDMRGLSHGKSERANCIEAHWYDKSALDENGKIIPWTYKTDMPHETFMIYEDGEPYCRGVVFDIKDIK